MRLLPLLFSCLLLLTLVSCNKDDDMDTAPSRMELLTNGVWAGDQVHAEGTDMTTEVNTYFGIDVKQLRYNFKKDGTVEEASDIEAVPEGSWEFTNDEQAIIINKGTEEEQVFTINQLTASDLYLEGEFEIDEEMVIEAEIRLKRTSM